METPHAIRQYIELLQANDALLTGQTKILISYLEQRLPGEPQNGKACPVCERKCYPACRVCPHCQYRMKPKKRRVDAALPLPPEPEPLHHNDCQKCFKPVDQSTEHRLQCGCLYHIQCLRKITQEKYPENRRCFCENGGPIPKDFYTSGLSSS